MAAAAAVLPPSRRRVGRPLRGWLLAAGVGALAGLRALDPPGFVRPPAPRGLRRPGARRGEASRRDLAAVAQRAGAGSGGGSLDDEFALLEELDEEDDDWNGNPAAQVAGAMDPGAISEEQLDNWGSVPGDAGAAGAEGPVAAGGTSGGAAGGAKTDEIKGAYSRWTDDQTLYNFGLPVAELNRRQKEAGVSDEAELLKARVAAAKYSGHRGKDLEKAFEDDLKKLPGFEGLANMTEASEEEMLNKLIARSAEQSSDEIVGKHKWGYVKLNETREFKFSQVPGGEMQMLQAMKSDTLDTFEEIDAMFRGFGCSPSARDLTRFLATVPPPIDLQGKITVEIGAGVGVPSVLAAKLGAKKVLLTDIDTMPLKEALETAEEHDVLTKVTTMVSNWTDVPDRLFSAEPSSVLAKYAKASVFLSAANIWRKEQAHEHAEITERLLRTPDQVMLHMFPYNCAHRKLFMGLLKERGLVVKEAEMAFWEDATQDRDSSRDDINVLLTVRRAA